jgi:hypothetical protein
MFVLPTLFPDHTFKMNMAWGRELIFSYNFLSPLIFMCTYYYVAARSCQESGATQPEATTHALPDAFPSLGEPSVYILQFPSVLTSIQVTTV